MTRHETPDPGHRPLSYDGHREKENSEPKSDFTITDSVPDDGR
jgi:hypothetical protein